MTRRMLLGLVTLGMLTGCGTSPQFYGWPTQGGTGTPPVIEAYYAPQTGPGSTLKIFLRAKDPNGDMLYIACMPSETGLGPGTTNEIPLKGSDRAEFSGYLAMPIPVFDPFEAAGTNFTMTILIRDQQGNVYPSTVAYIATLLLHRYKVLGILDDEGRAMQSAGILALPDAVKVIEHETAPVKGKVCPSCGAAAMIKRDGCEFCTACGHTGQCN